MLDFLVDFYNKHFDKKISFYYSDFFECRFYQFDFEVV